MAQKVDIEFGALDTAGHQQTNSLVQKHVVQQYAIEATVDCASISERHSIGSSYAPAPSLIGELADLLINSCVCFYDPSSSLISRIIWLVVLHIGCHCKKHLTFFRVAW